MQPYRRLPHVEARFSQMFEGIDVLVEQRLIQPERVLVYSLS
jgi:hypothetical protein